MTATADMLFVGQEPVGRELAEKLGEDKLTWLADPYEALKEMGRRRWDAVILWSACGEFESLCQASRRLQRDGRLLAICPPAQESQIRSLVGKVLDDYLIYPLTT